jgi:methylase of polypeptide subunit release factors
MAKSAPVVCSTIHITARSGTLFDREQSQVPSDEMLYVMTLSILDSGALVALGRALAGTGYHFTTVTPATHRRINARPENRWAADLRGVFGWSRPWQDGVVPPALLDLMREAGVLVESAQGYRSSVRASTLDGRLYFHSAFPPLADDAVFFGPDTYRFVAAIDRSADRLPDAPLRIADIGCGAAPAAIELALRYPGAEVFAADVNQTALLLARANATLCGAADVQARTSSLLDGLEGDFDLVVANPPYMLDAGQRSYRDGGGLLGAQLSIDLVGAALARLRPGGTLLLYTGVAMLGARDVFLEAIRPALEDAGARWSYEELDPDVFGEQLEAPEYRRVERIAAVWLQATVS